MVLLERGACARQHRARPLHVASGLEVSCVAQPDLVRVRLRARVRVRVRARARVRARVRARARARVRVRVRVRVSLDAPKVEGQVVLLLDVTARAE